MATTTETKIIEIKIPVSEGIKQIQLLTAEIERLRAGQADLKKGDAAQKQQYEQNAIAIKEYTRQKTILQREVQTEIKATQSAMGAYQKLQTEYTKAATSAKNLAAAHGVGSEKAKAAADKAFELGERLKQIDASVNQHQRNVGNYAGSLDDLNNKYINGLTGIQSFITANGGLAGSFKVAGQAVLGFGKQLLGLLANPIVATIAAIAGAFMLLKKGLETNREGTEKLNQIFAVFKDLLQGALTIIGNVANALLSGVTAVAEFTAKLFSFIPAVKDLNESNQESIRIEKELQRIRRADIVDRAEDAINERKIAELKKKMRMKDVYDEKQRLDFARQIDKLALDNALGDKKRAEDEIKAFQDRMRKAGKFSQTQYNEDEMNAFADLIVKKENTLKEYYQTTTRSASMAATLTQEIEAEREAAAQASIERLKKQEEEFTAKKKADEEKRLADLRSYIATQKGIINDQLDLYKKQLQPKEASLVDKVTADAMAVLNASIQKNAAIVANDNEATRLQIENAERLKQEKRNKMLDTANAGADILQGAFDFTSALADAELNLWAKQNKGKANFDEEYAKKRAELEHQQAVRNKIMQIVNSIINTASAVVAQLSVPGAGPALAWAAGIAGALQTAAIIATPIPDKDATSYSGSGASSPSLPPDLTSKMASPLTNSVQSIGAMGGSNAITSGAANAAIAPPFDYNAMAKVMSNLPAPELSIVELRTKEKQVDFIDNVSTLKS